MNGQRELEGLSAVATDPPSGVREAMVYVVNEGGNARLVAAAVSSIPLLEGSSPRLTWSISK